MLNCIRNIFVLAAAIAALIFSNAAASADELAIPLFNPSSQCLYWLQSDGNVLIKNVITGAKTTVKVFLDEEKHGGKYPQAPDGLAVAMSSRTVYFIQASDALDKLFIVYGENIHKNPTAALYNLTNNSVIFSKQINSQVKYYSAQCDFEKDTYKLALLAWNINSNKIAWDVKAESVTSHTANPADDGRSYLLWIPDTILIYNLKTSAIDCQYDINPSINQDYYYNPFVEFNDYIIKNSSGNLPLAYCERARMFCNAHAFIPVKSYYKYKEQDSGLPAIITKEAKDFSFHYITGAVSAIKYENDFIAVQTKSDNKVTLVKKNDFQSKKTFLFPKETNLIGAFCNADAVLGYCLEHNKTSGDSAVKIVESKGDSFSTIFSFPVTYELGDFSYCAKIDSTRVILVFDRGYVRLSYKNHKCKITAVVDLYEEKE